MRGIIDNIRDAKLNITVAIPLDTIMERGLRLSDYQPLYPDRPWNETWYIEKKAL